MAHLRVALVGFGNIGTGLVRHLSEHAATLSQKFAAPVELAWICDRDLDRDRGVAIPAGTRMTADYREVLADPSVHAVIELVGGTGFARELAEAAIRAGKHVVTANKALLAAHGPGLAELAALSGVRLLYEAAVGAGIPLIRGLEHGLAAARIHALHGIVNGTTNYILTRMDEQPGTTFEETLKAAMALGYAEPDPTLDVDGHDSAHKLVVLAMIAFGQDARPADVRTEGIRRIAPSDLRFAREKGLALRLLASASVAPDGLLDLAVRPAFVPAGHLLGGVRGVYNGIWVEAEPIGPTFYFGAGAGQGSTSSGILANIADLAEDLARGSRPSASPLRGIGGRRDHLRNTTHWPERYVRGQASREVDGGAIARRMGGKLLFQFGREVALLVPEADASRRLGVFEELAHVGIAPETIAEVDMALGSRNLV